jgi:hypothetical protein
MRLVFHLCRHAAALVGVLLVFRDFPQAVSPSNAQWQARGTPVGPTSSQTAKDIIRADHIANPSENAMVQQGGSKPRIAMPPHFANDAEHRRKRAEEMRLLAADMADVETKQTTLRLAGDYDRLTARAAGRGAGVSNQRTARRPARAPLHRSGGNSVAPRH